MTETLPTIFPTGREFGYWGPRVKGRHKEFIIKLCILQKGIKNEEHWLTHLPADKQSVTHTSGALWCPSLNVPLSQPSLPYSRSQAYFLLRYCSFKPLDFFKESLFEP